MNLLEQMARHQGEALWYKGESIRYPALLKQAQLLAKRWGAQRQLIALRALHRPDTVVIYLAALIGRHPLILLNPKMDEASQQQIIERYIPNRIYLSGLSGSIHNHQRQLTLNEDLALMLTTSGSTGGVKLVQLSLKNLSANAASIADYLKMDSHSRVISALPLGYSYGLSLLNSHLWCGGSMVLTEPDPLSREFWQLLREQRVTQLAGVPYSYQIYEQLRIRRSDWPDLEVLTQAGGRLEPRLAEQFANWASLQGKSFYVMYGQTEATARISYLPTVQVLAKPSSIGVAIPGGELMIVGDQGQPVTKAGVEGEIVYRGDNVMIGYAEQVTDLAPRAPLEQLYTGDIGYHDHDGFFYVTGRLKRMIKLSGVRTALDALEATLRAQSLQATCCGKDEMLCVALPDLAQREQTEQYLRETMHLHPSRYQLAILKNIPMTANGKVDYPTLQQQIAGEHVSAF
ncbi:AMP-binding protein [Celerinatantimonas sp. YJH-8]|uniref:AMP-binding protein n=1 Tax=Celerinatantimonas sp. YJH-8 TaxID=3228714 RepID=UPI0038CBA4BF